MRPQALHLAAWRGHLACVEALLAAGFPPLTKSARGWLALDDATAARERACARALLRAVRDAAKAEFKARRAALLSELRSMPDYSMQVDLGWGSKSGVGTPALLVLLLRLPGVAGTGAR